MRLVLDSCEKKDTGRFSSLSPDVLEVGSHVGGQNILWETDAY